MTPAAAEPCMPAEGKVREATPGPFPCLGGTIVRVEPFFGQYLQWNSGGATCSSGRNTLAGRAPVR